MSARTRMAGWIHSGDGDDPFGLVYCPHGHHIPRRQVLQFHESGWITCEYHTAARRPPCGAQLLILKVLRPARADDRQHRVKLYVAEVDWSEVRYLETAPEGHDVYQMLKWLGCHYMPAVAPPAVSCAGPAASAMLSAPPTETR